MVDRCPFHAPEQIFQDAQARVTQLQEQRELLDYIAFVPDGEPTLDEHLGTEIALLRSLGIPVGVITNSSLLWREDVREELARADWVSLKVDSVDERIWRRINRPHPSVQLSRVLEGIRAFARTFTGALVTETMLVKGINDHEPCMREVTAFLEEVQPQRAYLSIPTRPPTEKWVCAPDEATLNRMYQILAAALPQVEYLIGYEGNDFASTGDPEKDLLNITAVHPMRAEAVRALLDRTGSSWQVVERLMLKGDLTKTEYDGHTFYLRRFTKSEEAGG
jgi:wyosine [tRNA(Phe)-imidazoG37] synthetase (radical SAM superfamily)